MAMSEGSITINPVTGTASGSGLAKEIFDELDSATDYGTVTGASLAAAKEQVAAIFRACAKVVPHIVSNAVVSTTISLGTTANGVTAGGASVPVTGSTTGTVS